MSRPLRRPDGRVNVNRRDLEELERRVAWLKKKVEVAEDRMTMHSAKAEASALERAAALMTDELNNRAITGAEKEFR